MTTMSKETLIEELKKLISSRESLMGAYSRKRSWRRSERVMSMAAAQQSIDALRDAIEFIERRMDNG
jgi:hypothetical protein